MKLEDAIYIAGAIGLGYWIAKKRAASSAATTQAVTAPTPAQPAEQPIVVIDYPDPYGYGYGYPFPYPGWGRGGHHHRRHH